MMCDFCKQTVQAQTCLVNLSVFHALLLLCEVGIFYCYSVLRLPHSALCQL